MTPKGLLLLLALAGCGGEADPRGALPIRASLCVGQDSLVIDGTQSDATYVCTLQRSGPEATWANMDAHYVEAQVSSVPWLHYVLGLSVKVSPVPFDQPLDIGARPDLVKDLHLKTIDGMGDSAFVGSYSRTVTFSGSMTVGQGNAPRVSICIASSVGTAGSTRSSVVWMRAETVCE